MSDTEQALNGYTGIFVVLWIVFFFSFFFISFKSSLSLRMSISSIDFFSLKNMFSFGS